MSITRHDIRQITDDNRGQPIISQAVVYGNVAYFAGVTPNPVVGDIKAQTAQVLRRVDELLKLAGTDKSKLLSVQVWIARRGHGGRGRAMSRTAAAGHRARLPAGPLTTSVASLRIPCRCIRRASLLSAP
ncbi:MAG TPA: Rid family hydrolase [Pseudolabrys sp.]|nr:Rid family hydrolase [Pseudolabrys sp.]